MLYRGLPKSRQRLLQNIFSIAVILSLILAPLNSALAADAASRPAKPASDAVSQGPPRI